MDTSNMNDHEAAKAIYLAGEHAAGWFLKPPPGWTHLAVSPDDRETLLTACIGAMYVRFVEVNSIVLSLTPQWIRREAERIVDVLIDAHRRELEAEYDLNK